MNRQDFDTLEIEANAAPVFCNHHVHIPRGYDCSKLLRIIQKEAIDQLEPWQNFWAYPMWYESALFPKID